jgi:uracil-DNA glycosylase
MFFEAMHPTWQSWLAQQKPVLEGIEKRLKTESDVVPEPSQIMRAFAEEPANIKVIILGQDPYPTRGDAIGLAFAMNPQRKPPRSLVNIVTELESDLGISSSANPDLTKWARQGVLLLNRTLTTKAGMAEAHSKLGWDEFTSAALSELSKRNKLVLVLWGSKAIKVGRSVATEDTVLLESAHPSPLSAYRGFFGSKPFSKTNEYLVALGLEPVDWSL